MTRNNSPPILTINKTSLVKKKRLSPSPKKVNIFYDSKKQKEISPGILLLKSNSQNGNKQKKN